MEFGFSFGDASEDPEKDERIAFHLNSVLLSGPHFYPIVRDVQISEQTNDHMIVRSDEAICASFALDFREKCIEKAHEAYRRMFSLAEGYNLYRFWNFIPRINELTEGERTYALFNKGRSRAFQDAFNDPHIRMPAATGIDIKGDRLVVAFLAGKRTPSHFENPLQVSAYRYPLKGVGSPPSFARGTKARLHGKEHILISGTASIRGSESMHLGDIERQLDTTIENIFLVLKEMGFGKGEFLSEYRYNPIIFVKEMPLFGPVKSAIEKRYPFFSGGIYLLAEVCRPELLVEISVSARKI